MENAALGKHNNFHTSYNLFLQQNPCFRMLAHFPLPSLKPIVVRAAPRLDVFLCRNATLPNQFHFSFLSSFACVA